MKLEVNKSYRNDNGDKVEIIRSFVNSGETLYAGILTKTQDQYFQAFHEDGKWNITHGDTSYILKHHLVSEWKDPPLEGEFYVYLDTFEKLVKGDYKSYGHYAKKRSELNLKEDVIKVRIVEVQE